ncbi:MAG TPA: response regulator [Saprospiraceae bacterium]|nr:response regulator [Saprospiraceae bacterium]
MNQEKVRLMVVDDEAHIGMALDHIFSVAGYEVKTFTDGFSALEAVTSFAPKVVILDVMMPGIDGFAVAKAIRQRPGLDQTAIVFLTAKGTLDDKMQGYDAGAEVYVVKPFDNDDLLDKVSEILSLNE